MSSTEKRRLEAIRDLKLAMGEVDERFERITRSASRLLGVPVAAISVVEEDLQWFCSLQGAPQRTIKRDRSFCNLALAKRNLLVVPDTLDDPRYAYLDGVRDGPQIRFYAGQPLLTSSGYAIGTLCIVDFQPRVLSADEKLTLQELAAWAESEINASKIAVKQQRLEIKNQVLRMRLEEDDLTASMTATTVTQLKTSLGRNLGDFVVTGLIGEGGMGLVYRGVDPATNRFVAIKVLRLERCSGAEFLARFDLEAKLLAKLSHPNIVEIYDRGTLPTGAPYITMEYLQGASWEVLMTKHQGHAEAVVAVMLSVLEALEYVHAHGTVHRDIKPSNVFVTNDGLCKLLDFGVAKMTEVDSHLTGTKVTLDGQVVGTPAYMAPEQIVEKNVGAAADLYSIGVILYESLAGHCPFEGDSNIAVLSAHLNDPPPPIPNIGPPSLQEIIHQCLAKEAAQRPSGAKELASALRDAVPGAAEVRLGDLLSSVKVPRS